MDAVRRLKRSPDDPAPPVGIVHIGPGAFFRAFNAVFTQEAVSLAGGRWGIRAVSLRGSDIRARLRPQGWAYTAVSMDPGGEHSQEITVLRDILVLAEDPEAVIDALADPAVRIVTLTVTEKGYGHNALTGRLDLENPQIRRDLSRLQKPTTMPGVLVAALGRRWAAGARPFSVLSCDNLPANGRIARQVVLDFARAVDPALAGWIASEARFPATMVDRITPATTEADIARLSGLLGVEDRGCVFHEPFRQWVIEDDFVDGSRPEWDRAGAQFVQDVSVFETTKLRCLNGTHSALAYLGYLAGHETIAAAVADPVFARFCIYLWAEEILPTVPPPPGTDLPAYCEALLERYRNPTIRHRTSQIAMDGSQKLPQRILATIAEGLAAGREMPGLILAVAAWMRYVGGVDERGQVIDVRDPMASRLCKSLAGLTVPREIVATLLAEEQVFDPALTRRDDFVQAVVAAYEQLLSRGARAACANLVPHPDTEA